MESDFWVLFTFMFSVIFMIYLFCDACLLIQLLYVPLHNSSVSRFIWWLLFTRLMVGVGLSTSILFLISTYHFSSLLPQSTSS